MRLNGTVLLTNHLRMTQTLSRTLFYDRLFSNRNQEKVTMHFCLFSLGFPSCFFLPFLHLFPKPNYETANGGRSGPPGGRAKISPPGETTTANSMTFCDVCWYWGIIFPLGTLWMEPTTWVKSLLQSSWKKKRGGSEKMKKHYSKHH